MTLGGQKWQLFIAFTVYIFRIFRNKAIIIMLHYLFVIGYG